MTLLSILLALPAAAQADSEWLMVGNSYTSRNDLSGVLGQMLAQDVPAWATVDVASVTQGGQTFTGHLDNADGTNGDTALRQHLVTSPQAWQVVILQEQSQTPGFPQSDGLWTSSRDAMVALDDMVDATGADTLMFLTWGRRSGDNQNPTLYPDYPTMQDALTGGYLAYMEEAATDGRPIFAAPVGEAFRVIYDDAAQGGADPAVEGTPFWELYSSDGSHPSIAGSTLAAATMQLAWTGRRPTPLQALDDAGLDTNRQQTLFDVAEAVTTGDPKGDFPWPWVHDWADWTGPIDGDVQRPMVLVEGEVTTGAIEIDDGSLMLRGQAALTADSIAMTDASTLIWKRGFLSADAIGAGLSIPDEGVLEIASVTDVAGPVTGTGTVSWVGSLGDKTELAVLTTQGLNSANLDIQIAGDLAWEVRDDALWVIGEASANGGTDDSKGCGCDTGSAPVWSVWLVLPWLLVGRRR